MNLMWFRLSFYFTLLAWLAVLTGVLAVYYNGQPGGSYLIVVAGPLALVSSVATCIEWVCSHTD